MLGWDGRVDDLDFWHGVMTGTSDLPERIMILNTFISRIDSNLTVVVGDVSERMRTMITMSMKQ